MSASVDRVAIRRSVGSVDLTLLKAYTLDRARRGLPVDVVGPECLDEEPFELAVPPLPGLEEAQETPAPTAPTTPTFSEPTPAVTPLAGR